MKFVAMALSGTHASRPTNNSVAALFIRPVKIIRRPPSDTRPRVLFCVNQKPSLAISASVSCSSTNGNDFYIGAKSMLNSRPDPFQEDGLSRMLELALKERETLWQLYNHKEPFRVAYQGVPGAYSEEAAMAVHPGCHALPCPDYETAFRSVEQHNADRAILPVESTVEGTIHPNYDLLLHHRLRVVGEIHFPVQYCLLVLPGVARAQIERVVSHPLAILQCERTLASLGLGNASRQTNVDTAGAAEYVCLNNLRHAAAIASARAAEIYGLRVVARGIQDEYCNFTRFLILAREPVAPAADQPQKTSILIGHDGGSVDVLFRIVSAFSFRGINLTKLERRPGPGWRKMTGNPLRGEGGLNFKRFQHVFYIDFVASTADGRGQRALTELQEFTNFLRVLGSYPADPREQEI